MIVRLSAQFRFTIPKPLRDRLGIMPGQRFMATERNGSIVLTPVPADPAEYLCGILEGEPSATQELLRERAKDLEVEESRIPRPPDADL